jgi:hypothetical protein
MMPENTPEFNPIPNSSDANSKITPTKVGWVIFWSVLSLIVTIIATMSVTKEYGVALYVGVPVTIGFIVGFVGKNLKGLIKGTVAVVLTTTFLSLLLIALKIEGAICIIMIIVPLFLFVAVGFGIGKLLLHLVPKNNSYLVLFFLINPACIAADTQIEMVENTITSKTVVNATPAQIWQVLTNEVDFGKHENFFFKNGVNYPLDMRLTQRNDSMLLRCNLRNCVTELYVDELVPNKSLRFRSVKDVEPVKELTIYDTLSTPHTNGEYFKHLYGKFELVPLSNGTTELVAESQFSYRLSPAFYWNWWSKYLVSTMHNRVLQIVKDKTEHKHTQI